MWKYFVIPAIFLAGCTTPTSLPFSTKTVDNGICTSEPVWSINPPIKKGIIYGVGIAPQNFKGEQAQRQSAIAKAINEIAAQMKTTVNSQTVIHSAVMNHKSATSSMSNVSFQTVDGQKVSAVIVKSCKNPQTGYLYILMKSSK